MKILSILCLGAIFGLSTVLSVGVRGPLHTPFRAEDGGFDIGNCTPEETELIKEGLRLGQIAAREALQDVGKGRYSKYGFWALFKSQNNALKVQQMLKNLATLPPMPHIHRDGLDQTSSPVFVCASEDRTEELMKESWQRCKDHGKEAGHNVRGTAHIVLCPQYFQVPVGPDPQKNEDFCPTLRNNRYFGLYRRLRHFQFNVLLHKLVHFYLGEEDRFNIVGETYKLNRIVGQSPQDSRRTPTAYAFYIAFSFTNVTPTARQRSSSTANSSETVCVVVAVPTLVYPFRVSFTNFYAYRTTKINLNREFFLSLLQSSTKAQSTMAQSAIPPLVMPPPPMPIWQVLHAPNSAEALLFRGNHELAAGNAARALELYTQVLYVKCPGHPCAFLNRSLAYISLGYPELAVMDAYRARTVCRWTREIGIPSREEEDFCDGIARYMYAEEQYAMHNHPWTLRPSCFVGHGWLAKDFARITLRHNLSLAQDEIPWDRLEKCAVYRMAGALGMCGLGANSDALGEIDNLRKCRAYMLTHDEQNQFTFLGDAIINSSTEPLEMKDRGTAMAVWKSQMTLVNRVIYPWNDHVPNMNNYQDRAELETYVDEIAPACTIYHALPTRQYGETFRLVANRDILPDEIVLAEGSILQVTTAPSANSRRGYHCDACAAAIITTETGCEPMTPSKLPKADNDKDMERSSQRGSSADPRSSSSFWRESVEGGDVPKAYGDETMEDEDAAMGGDVVPLNEDERMEDEDELTEDDTKSVESDEDSTLSQYEPVEEEYDPIEDEHEPMEWNETISIFEDNEQIGDGDEEMAEDEESLEEGEIRDPERGFPPAALQPAPYTKQEEKSDMSFGCEPPSPPSDEKLANTPDFMSCNLCYKAAFCGQNCYIDADSYHAKICRTSLESNIREECLYNAAKVQEEDLATMKKGLLVNPKSRCIYDLLFVRLASTAAQRGMNVLDINEVKWLNGDLRSPTRPESSDDDTVVKTLPWSFTNNVVLPFRFFTHLGVDPVYNLPHTDGWVINTLYAKIMQSTRITQGVRHAKLYDERGKLLTQASPAPQECVRQSVWVGSIHPVLSMMWLAAKVGERYNVGVREGREVLGTAPGGGYVPTGEEEEEGVVESTPAIGEGEEIVRGRGVGEVWGRRGRGRDWER
ncbi:hypothetical protein MMC30_009195 [Trapelia coarctata]|nr:hypothetical protein [Trapelia coarctata]